MSLLDRRSNFVCHSWWCLCSVQSLLWHWSSVNEADPCAVEKTYLIRVSALIKLVMMVVMGGKEMLKHSVFVTIVKVEARDSIPISLMPF